MKIIQPRNDKKNFSSDGPKASDDTNKGETSQEKTATIHVCGKCDFQSRSESVINEHIQMDHQESNKQIVYLCDECEKTFASQAEFRTHAKDKHSKVEYTCDHCGNKLNSIEGLDNHISMFHTKQNIPCEFCRYKAGNQEMLDSHLKQKHKIFKEDSTSSETTLNKPKVFYSEAERKRNGVCSFWNNSSCSYQERCRFAHEEIPYCHFQERCNRMDVCPFFHNQPLKHRGFQRNNQNGSRRQPYQQFQQFQQFHQSQQFQQNPTRGHHFGQGQRN